MGLEDGSLRIPHPLGDLDPKCLELDPSGLEGGTQAGHLRIGIGDGVLGDLSDTAE